MIIWICYGFVKKSLLKGIFSVNKYDERCKFWMFYVSNYVNNSK